jgi:hypothetical protein
MSRTRARCTQTEVTRILKAAAKAGVSVRVEIAPDGKIIVISAKPSEVDANGSCTNPWDEVLLEHEQH